MPNGTSKPANPQPDLPGLAGSNGSEEPEIKFQELASLQARLATEGRFISTLQLRRQGGYTVTIRRLGVFLEMDALRKCAGNEQQARNQ